MPLWTALSAQEAAQLGFNCISTQLVQTALRLTLQDLKWFSEQSRRRMHQSPLHAHKVLEGSHPYSWGTNHSISFCADDSKRPANCWCHSGQGKQDKKFEQRGSTRILCKALDEFNPSPLYLYNAEAVHCIRAPGSHSTAANPVSAEETIMSHTQTPIPDWAFLVFLFAPDTSSQPCS